MSRHILHGVVLERAVEGRLGGDALRHLGVQGMRPPAQANQDVAPAGGVPEGLGEGVRLGAGCPLWGGEFVWPGCPGAPGYPPSLLAHPRCPPPRDSKGAPKKACRPEAPACARITRCATTMRRVSEINTTYARHSATVCQCRRTDVTFASATRMGPGRGSMSPHRNRRMGGGGLALGGGVSLPGSPSQWGGER